MEGNPELFIGKLVNLFPDGPPSQEMLDVAIHATMPVGSTDRGAEIVQVDNANQYRAVMPIGTEISGTRKGRSKWEIKVSSPKSPHGHQINWAQDVEGDRETMLLVISSVAGDIIEIKRKLMFALTQHGASDPYELSPSLGPIIQTYQSQDELIFDWFYQEIAKQIQYDPPQIINLDFLGLTASSDIEVESPVAISLLCAIALHEAWRAKAESNFLEDIAMAKNNGDHSWWKFTGNFKNINKVTNALTHNRHFIVQDTKTSIYLNIQDSETKFVEGLAKSNSTNCARVDEPAYGVALCEKKSTNVQLHQRACGGCSRIRKNGVSQANQTDVDDSPEVASEQMQILNILAPWVDRNENDYKGFALDYRRCADELLKLAEHHSQIADYYESLLVPTNAVTEAEELLANARRDEKAERDRVKAELAALKSSGPPA